MRRSYDKHIRLTKEERDDWQRKAAMTCLNESSLIRMLMKGLKLCESCQLLETILISLPPKQTLLGLLTPQCSIVKLSDGTNFRRILRAYFYALTQWT